MGASGQDVRSIPVTVRMAHGWSDDHESDVGRVMIWVGGILLAVIGSFVLFFSLSVYLGRGLIADVLVEIDQRRR